MFSFLYLFHRLMQVCFTHNLSYFFINRGLVDETIIFLNDGKQMRKKSESTNYNTADK